MSHTIGSILTLLLLLLVVVTMSVPACSAYQCYQCFATDKNDPCVTPSAAPNFTNVTCGGLCYYSRVNNITESDGGVTTILLDHVVRGCINDNTQQPEMCAQRRQELDIATIVTTVCLCMGDYCNSSTRAAGSPVPPLLLLLLPFAATAAAASLSAVGPGPFSIT